ncbi:MAG: Smr/MutS family protein [Candidatus Pacebacteria bacterium]|nr:Smr/MutS family protein [Candidatus Paceibacterota bacterium]
MKNKKKKYNKYLQDIQLELDLHGLTREEARSEVLDFLNEAKRSGNSKVRIITGKGLHSENSRGVLKEHIESILEGEGLEFCDAKISEGGSGALNVTIE